MLLLLVMMIMLLVAHKAFVWLLFKRMLRDCCGCG